MFLKQQIDIEIKNISFVKNEAMKKIVIILTVFAFFIISCKSAKTITQAEQTQIMGVTDLTIDMEKLKSYMPFGKATIMSESGNTIEELCFFEVQPLFDDKPADEAFPVYVLKNLIWTQKMDGITGRVFVEFIIETDGSVSNAKIIRGIDPLADAEALRLINSSSSKWTPAKLQGTSVRVKYLFSVPFMLMSADYFFPSLY